MWFYAIFFYSWLFQTLHHFEDSSTNLTAVVPNLTSLHSYGLLFLVILTIPCNLNANLSHESTVSRPLKKEEEEEEEEEGKK
jgi:hypothetical protein